MTAQEQPSTAPRLSVQSQLVLVPTEVRTKKGDIIFGLKAEDFLLEADGVPQKVRLDVSDDSLPLSLVVLVQCSRDAWREGPKIKGLSGMVDALTGGTSSQVAVVDFGKELELLTGLTSDPNRRAAAFQKLAPCPEDTGASVYDALFYANRLLDRDHATGRRVILMVSETRDHGSLAKPVSLIEALNRSNTLVDAITFSPGSEAVTEDLKSGDGAAGGVFGLLGLAMQALRKNAPKEIAHETGGAYLHFGSERGFDENLNNLSNRLHNAYELSFVPHPSAQDAGAAGSFHSVHVRIPKYPDAVLQYRANYWAASERQILSQP